MKKCLFLLFLGGLLLVTKNINAQVKSSIFTDSTELVRSVPWYGSHKPTPIIVEASSPITKKILDSLSLEENVSRFGVDVPVNITEEDGQFYDYGDHLNFKLTVGKGSSKSIRVIWESLSLPDSSVMFVYGENSNFLIGPITQKNIHNGKYSTDLIPAGLATIDVLMPEHSLNDFHFTISTIIRGEEYDESYLSFDSEFGSSSGCSPDVVCLGSNIPSLSSFNDAGLFDLELIKKQETAVCKVIVQGGSGSGFLVNNECENYRPLILTADHVTTGVDPASIVFRFNYKSAECGRLDENGRRISLSKGPEPLPSTWVTYTGASLLSSIGGEIDIALFELLDPLELTDLIRFTGWDRSNTIPMESVIFSHPAGDTKKYSYGPEPSIIDDNGDTYLLRLRNGAWEGGMSGAPQFNESSRVVGLVSRGRPVVCNQTNLTGHTGRIFAAWDGGSQSTRLKDWLGSVNEPMVLDDLELPSITGEQEICHGDIHTYELLNPIPGHIVTWTVSPPEMFSGDVSGNGTLANLSIRNTYVKGEATVTFFSQSPIIGCSPAALRFNIDVGKPVIENVLTPDCFNESLNSTIFATVSGENSLTWRFPKCPLPNDSPDPDPDCWFNYTGNLPTIRVHVGPQSGEISLFASNDCGTSSINIPIEFCEDKPGPSPGGGLVIIKNLRENNEEAEKIIKSVFPNPANKDLNVNFSNKAEGNLQIICSLGKVRLYKSISSKNTRLDVSELETGKYYLKFSSKEETIVKSFVVQR